MSQSAAERNGRSRAIGLRKLIARLTPINARFFQSLSVHVQKRILDEVRTSASFEMQVITLQAHLNRDKIALVAERDGRDEPAVKKFRSPSTDKPSLISRKVSLPKKVSSPVTPKPRKLAKPEGNKAWKLPAAEPPPLSPGAPLVEKTKPPHFASTASDISDVGAKFVEYRRRQEEERAAKEAVLQKPTEISAEVTALRCREIDIDMWDEGICRFVNRRVTYAQYVRHTMHRLLKYQQLKELRPEKYPDPETLAAKLGIVFG